MDPSRNIKLLKEEMETLRSRVSRLGSELGIVEFFLLILIIFTFVTNTWQLFL